MLSKKQADAASEALLQSGRHRRDQASPVLARFPELATFPMADRAATLTRANRAAWRRWPVLIVTAAILAAVAVWLWAFLVARNEAAESVWWSPLLAAWTLRMVVQGQARRELRRLVKSNPADR